MNHRHAWNGPFITVSGAYEGRMAAGTGGLAMRAAAK